MKRKRKERGRRERAECSFKWKLALPLMAGTNNDDPPDYLNMVSAVFTCAHTHKIFTQPSSHMSTHLCTLLKACKNLLMTHTHIHTHSSTPPRDGEQRESVMMHHFLKHLYPSSFPHSLLFTPFSWRKLLYVCTYTAVDMLIYSVCVSEFLLQTLNTQVNIYVSVLHLLVNLSWSNKKLKHSHE